MELLRKKQPILKKKRVGKGKTTSVPPAGAPSWCLSMEALQKLKRSTENIPNYDPENNDDNDHIDDIDSDHQNDESDNNNAESSKKNKRKNKSHKQEKKRKEQEKKRKEKHAKKSKTR